MLSEYLRRHRVWCLATFGERRTVKFICNHIRKELVEIEAAPNDVREWADVIGLALHGAWRTGATPEEVVAALVAKQGVNELRKWILPENEDEPIEHDRTGEE
jgi:hypothetical protein